MSNITSKMPPVYIILIQVFTASVSFVSSTIMACSIAWFGSEGSTPYRRIILGLSISDVLQSLAFFTGPSSVPVSKRSWQVGNEVMSCQVNGFVAQIGATGVALHTIFLCVYYLCRLKYRMDNNAFEYNIERRFRVFIVIFSLSAGIVPLVMDAFHTSSRFYSICTIDIVPTGCWREPDQVGECDATSKEQSDILTAIFIQGFSMLCLMTVAVIMGLLYHHALIQNQNIERETSTCTLENNETNEQNNCKGSVEEEEMMDTPQGRVQQISRLYRREMTIQATLYVGAFSLMYIPVAIGPLTTGPVSLQLITMTFFPIGGLMNILVYTRPKVANLRRDNPECSRMRGFWLVLIEGGEIPREVDLSISCCQGCCSQPTWLESEDEFELTSDADSKRGAWLTSFGIHLSRIGF